MSIAPRGRVFGFEDRATGDLTLMTGRNRTQAWKNLANVAADGEVALAQEMFRESGNVPRVVYYIHYLQGAKDVKMGPYTKKQMKELRDQHDADMLIGVNKDVILKVEKETARTT